MANLAVQRCLLAVAASAQLCSSCFRHPTIRGQVELQEFGQSGCSQGDDLTGLFLSGDVRDLSPLRNLTRLCTLSVFACPLLESLEGLEGLASAGSVSLYQLPRLQNINGLHGLTSLTGTLEIADCQLLESLEGLEGLASAGSVFLNQLARLPNISGLRRLTSLTGNLQIVDCQLLESLEGLEGLASAGSVFLNQLPRLQNISGLRGLRGGLSGGIRLASCPQVRSLGGLEGISSAGAVRLETLLQLQDLGGLSGLSGTGMIKVSDCPLLRSLEGLHSLSSTGSVFLWRLPLLQDLTEFRGLKFTGGLSIRDCRSLASLHGLEQVTGLGATNEGWSLDLQRLPNLTNLTHLAGLHGRQPGGLQLLECQSLSSLNGLQNVSGFGGGSKLPGYALRLGNLMLSSLDGLQGLRGELSGALYIYSCPQLLTLEGLEGVTMLGKRDEGDSLTLSTLFSLTSLRGLRGLKGTLPGSLNILGADSLRDLEGLQGLSGATAAATSTAAVRVHNCPALQSLLGLRAMDGPLGGTLVLTELPALESLAGLEGLTNVTGLDIRCRRLRSLTGLSGLAGPFFGTSRIQSQSLKALGPFAAENVTFAAGAELFLLTQSPVCGGREAILARLEEALEGRGARSLLIPDGGAECRSCTPKCRATSYEDRLVTCDELHGGCRCPLGRTSPGCSEAPILDLALALEHRTLHVSLPAPSESPVRRLDLCVALRRSRPANGSTAVRLQRHAAAGDTQHSLLSPFNEVRWSRDDPTQGCLIVHLEVGRAGPSPSPSPPLHLVLAYESPSGGRFPDHLINGTLGEVGDLWDHPWPECISIGTCIEEQNEPALTVHFLDQEDCPESMEPDYYGCDRTQCEALLSPGSSLTPHFLQTACECNQSHSLVGRCVAKPGFWALNSGTLAVPCPGGNSTCLGGDRGCGAGHMGVMCAVCPATHVQQSGGCIDCTSSGHGILCALFTLLFLTSAGVLPHVLSSQCTLCRGDQVPWLTLWTKLRITGLKLQELMVWSWGFLLLFPEVRQRLGGSHVVEFLAEAFNNVAFPAFLQCRCGVDVFGEFGILVLAPTAFVLVTSASACLGGWTVTPSPEGGLISRCCQWWCERSGPQLVFFALRFTVSPVATLIIVYAPEPGLGFHCLSTGKQDCFFRRDYRMRRDSAEYARFSGLWLFCCLSQICNVLLLLFLCIRDGATALPEFRPKLAAFEIANLVRQTVLAGGVLFAPGSSLSMPWWSCFISTAYLALLHLFVPYRNRGDQLLQSFCTIGGIVIFMTLIVELVLAGSAEIPLDDAMGGWVRPLLHTTASTVLLSIAVAPFCGTLLHPTLCRFAAWCNKLRPAGARGNEIVLPRGAVYDSLLLEERNTGRELDPDSTPSLCELLMEGMDRIEMRCKIEDSPLPKDVVEAVTYARRFRLEEFVQPGDIDSFNRRWLHVYPGSEALTQETVRQLLEALTNILTETVGRKGQWRRRPLVMVSTKQPQMLVPSRGLALTPYSFILLREKKARLEGPTLRQLLEFGVKLLDYEEGAGMSKQSQIMERLVLYGLEEVQLWEQGLAGYLQENQQARHVVVRALGRSMDHEEATELPELLQRPLELGCLLHGMCPDPERSLRIVTRRPYRPSDDGIFFI